MLDELAKSFTGFGAVPILRLLVLENNQIEQREPSYRMRQLGPYVPGSPDGSDESSKRSRLDAGCRRPSAASVVPSHNGILGSARIPIHQAASVEIIKTHYH